MYIDGFAGRGHYDTPEGPVPGSPLLALSLMSKNEQYKTKVACFFNEENEFYYSCLNAEVEARQTSEPMSITPVVKNLKFSEFMKYMSNRLKETRTGQAPVFLFVDPCGLSDVRMSDLVDVLRRPGCELFLFFNYDGLKRIIGLAQTISSSPTLLSLFGSEPSVSSLVNKISGLKPHQKEQAIVAHFIEALKTESGAQYVLPFSIEHEDKRMTSHYLIHATKNAIGFRIMKTVMYNAARTSGSGTCLRLLQASNNRQHMIFDTPEVADMKQRILDKISEAPQMVKLFKTTWPERPNDMFSTEEYKEALLELEQQGKINVQDEHGVPRPAEKRRPDKGRPSLGDDYFVRRSDQTT